MNFVARSVTVFCFAWILSFWSLYGFSGARPAFHQFAGNYFEDAYDGTPLTFLAIPLILAGTVCTFFAIADCTKPFSSSGGGAWWTMERFTAAVLEQAPQQQQPHRHHHQQLAPPRLQVILHVVRQFRSSFRLGTSGDLNFDSFSACFILVPLTVYLLTAFARHSVTNSLGKIAILAMNILLVPVARHSAVLSAMGWNPASAVRMHIWAGRIILVAATAHGFLYLYRWKFYNQEQLLAMLIPPAKCWFGGSDEDEEYEPVCQHADTECSCYDHFRNWTGLVALMALLVLAVTSLNSVRRWCYALFYQSHVIAGPLVLIMVILHYRRCLLYIGGGLLYYLASTLPVLVENAVTARREGGVRVVSVECIQGRSRPCVALTVQASPMAVTRYRAGQYVKLFCPSISPISHPFTINTVPGKADQLRVIFRAVGPFTTALANAVTCSSSRSDYHHEESDHHQSTAAVAFPIISLEGFHGSPCRTLQVLQHDTVVVVAGGIGITPYLSLLCSVHSAMVNCSSSRNCPLSAKMQTRKLIVHWMCRDACLIDYVKKNYLDALLLLEEESTTTNEDDAQVVTDFQMDIVIHQTFDQTKLLPNTTTMVSLGNNHNKTLDSVVRNKSDGAIEMQNLHGSGIETITPPIPLPRGDGGVPFEPCKFAAASKTSYKANVLNLLSFGSVGWGGLAVIRYSAFHFDVASRVFPRIWGLVAVLVLAVVVAVVANVIYRTFFVVVADRDDERARDSWIPLKRHQSDVEDGIADVATITTTSSACVRQVRRRMVTLQEKCGRPAMAHLVRCLDHAACPGLFVCGPTILVDEVCNAVGHEKRWDPRRYLPSSRRQVALYEESFHL